MEQKMFSFGQWPLREAGQNAPLTWIVLKEEPERLLVHCAIGVHVMAYDETGHSVHWEKSTIRDWLDSVFYQTAFSRSEQEKILEVQTLNQRDVRNDPPTEYHVADRIFLLSEHEVRALGHTSAYWVREPSPLLAEDTYGAWWLRSYGRVEKRSMGVVRSDGVLYPSGDIRAGDVMVVPAMYIRKEGLRWL